MIVLRSAVLVIAGPIAVRKHAAALFRREKFILLQVCLTGRHLRRLERVFRCYIVCETKEDYKEGCLKVWANYMFPCSSTVGLYFKGTYDVVSVTMATHKVHKSVL